MPALVTSYDLTDTIRRVVDDFVAAHSAEIATVQGAGSKAIAAAGGVDVLAPVLGLIIGGMALSKDEPAPPLLEDAWLIEDREDREAARRAARRGMKDPNARMLRR